MEASVAAGAGESAGADAGAAEGAEGAAALDPAAVTAQLESMAAGQQEMYEFLQSHPGFSPTADAAADDATDQTTGNEVDFGFLEDPDLSPADLAASLSGLIEQAAEAKTTAAIAPLQKVIDGIQRDNQYQALLGEFPEMGDEKVSDEVLKASRVLAAQMGTPDLGESPQMWRLVYMAGRVADQMEKEGGDTPAVAHLEGGGGAGPGGGGQVDPVDSIMGAKKGASVLGSW